jgi:4-hydroxybutyryl-CoA dehydratase/vinylacetyl-CoA-Delta-isomerase
MYSNIAKFYYADNFHQIVKMVQDIGGGLVSGGISEKDFNNPETHPLLDKYFGGKAGIPTEFRLRAMRLARDLLNAWHLTVTIHGEGSLAAQFLAVNALGDWAKYKAAAKRAARIKDGTEHPMFSKLPDFPLNY